MVIVLPAFKVPAAVTFYLNNPACSHTKNSNPEENAAVVGTSSLPAHVLSLPKLLDRLTAKSSYHLTDLRAA